MKYIAVLVLTLLLCGCSTTETIKEEVFTVSLNSPKIQAGEFEAQFEKMVNIGDLRQANVTVDYYPLEDAVCLQYRLDFMTYYQFWSNDGRAAFLIALDKYKEDYILRNLDPKGSKKTKRQYGKVEGYLIWQAASYTVRAYANTDIELGYFIRDVSRSRAAFFTLNQRSAVFIDEMTKNEKRETNNMTMYLTRVQADELAELFDQNFLRSLTGGKIESRIENTNIDEY